MNTQGIGKLLAATTALLLIGGASAQITKQGNGYLFRLKFTKGQKISFTMDTDSSASGQKVHATVAVTQTVTAVSGGTGTVNFKTGEVSMDINGQKMKRPMPENMRNITAQIDSLGHVKGAAAAQQQTNIVFPTKPVPIGGTWTGTASAGAGGPSSQMAATYKFVGVEKLGAYNAAKVSVTMKGSGQMNITGSGTMWLNVVDGSMIKSVTNVKATVGTMVVPMRMVLSRK